MFTHVEKFNFPNLKRENFEGKRIYKTENGDRYPSVTTVPRHKDKTYQSMAETSRCETANKISRQAFCSRYENTLFV